MAAPYRDAVLATAGLVSLWPLNETTGSSAGDLKSGYSGTYAESPALGQASLLPNGEGASVGLNGTSQYVAIADQVALRVGDTFTFETWALPSELNGYSVFSGHNGGGELVLFGGKIILNKKEVVQLAESTKAIAAGSAYHLVATKNGATMKLYVNGVDVTGAAANATCTSEAQTWMLGRNGTRIEGFLKGRLQYAAIYSAALSAEVVAAHYAAASQVAGLRPGSRSLIGVGR